MPECEVTAKTYYQFEVIPGAVRALGEMELRQKAHGFYMTALDLAMIAEHPLAANQPMTLIAEAENVRVIKTDNETWVAGDWIYWDETGGVAGTFTNIPAADLYCVGKAQRAAALNDVLGFITMQDNYYPVQLGTSVLPVTLTAAQKQVAIHSTSAIVENVEPFIVETVLTGEGATGGRAKFTLETEVALGGWANALKAQIEFGDTGRVTGLGSAFCAEMVLPETAPPGGNYMVVEAEMVVPTGAGLGAGAAFYHCALNPGGDAGVFDDGGFLMDINVGATDNGHIFNEHGADAATGGLRVRINGATNWILVSNVAPA